MLEGFIAADKQYLLEEKLPEIKPSMLILWGKHDKVKFQNLKLIEISNSE